MKRENFSHKRRTLRVTDRRRLARVRQRGFSLILVAMSSVAIIGTLGLTADLGRVYIIRNELQTFVDAASLASAGELNGTGAGLDAANTAAIKGSANRWNFGTEPVSSVEAAFSERVDGIYAPLHSAPLESRFIRLTAAATASLYLLPIVPGVGSALPMRVSAVAGQAEIETPGAALSPLSPEAEDAADTIRFGFMPGEQYGLHYIDLGQGGRPADVHNGIVNNDYSAGGPVILRVGDAVDKAPGSIYTGAAIAARVAQDTDTRSLAYSTYSGNGRRTITVPVNNPKDGGRVVGFARFFLSVGNCAEDNSGCRGEYIGERAYAVRLFR